MLTLPEKLLFVVLAAVSFYFTYVGFKRVVGAVRRGDKGYYPRFNHLSERIGKSLARTMTQESVFKDRPVASAFHSFIFYGFVFYALVNVFDGLEGFVPAAYHPDWGFVGNVYRFGADIFSVLVIIGVVYFLVRRFVTGDKRLAFNDNTPLHEKVKAGSIKRDSLIVGTFIILHVGFRLFGAGYLLAAEGHLDPWQPFASTVANVAGFGDDRITGWHVGWWGALGLILAFLPYFPRSKHIHLFAAPVDYALERRHEDGREVSTGALEPIDFEDETLEQFGVAKLEHLRQTQLLDAYACIQCNRCTNVCPAQQTGKALSPAAVEINKRYELNQVAPLLAAGEETPRPVMDFVLDEPSLWACTACGACMDICPVGCNQMIDIIDIRRDQVMMQGEFPAELANAFRGMERTGNPWGISQDKREDWTEDLPGELDVPTVRENPDFEVLYWVGCAGSYDPQAQKTARSMAAILEHANINYAILGRGEKCTGDPARRSGNEYLYYQLASENVMTLNEVLIDETLDETKKKRVVTTCPHCFNALLNDYPQLGGDYDVVHHTQLIEELMQEGRLPPLDLSGNVTYHDPCYLGRHNGEYDAPRNILKSSGLSLTEMPRHRNNSFCCGAGGAQFWKEEEAGTERVSENRYREAKATGAEKVATGCPFCKVMLSSSDSAEADNAPEVVDVAQIVAERLASISARLGSAAD